MWPWTEFGNDGLGLRLPLRIWTVAHGYLARGLGCRGPASWLVWTAVQPGAHRFSARRSPGLQLLEERYARGEISRDEYLQKKVGTMLPAMLRCRMWEGDKPQWQQSIRSRPCKPSKSPL